MGADAVAHGATGKGNDQVRFELGYYANNANIEVIAPWRDWEFESRKDLIDFAEKNQIQVSKDKIGDPPFSTDANLLHTSSEGKILEDPWIEAPEYVYTRTKNIIETPNDPETLVIEFEKGDPISINDKIISDLTSTNKDAYRSDNIGIIFQQFNLLPYANVIDNIILPLYFSKQRSKKVENKTNAAMTLCDQLRLPESILNQKASNLSVGQQQRVAVARALIGSPSIIVADEPTSSLDTEAQELFLDLMFDQISKNSSTLLMVSHDKSLTNYFDQVIDINEILVREN